MAGVGVGVALVQVLVPVLVLLWDNLNHGWFASSRRPGRGGRRRTIRQMRMSIRRALCSTVCEKPF